MKPGREARRRLKIGNTLRLIEIWSKQGLSKPLPAPFKRSLTAALEELPMQRRLLRVDPAGVGRWVNTWLRRHMPTLLSRADAFGTVRKNARQKTR